MRTNHSGTFTRSFLMVLTLFALLLPVNLGLAQNQMPSRQGPQPEVPFRSPSNVPKRSITNDHRKAAAQRNHDRRADAHRKATASASQGVK